MRGLLCLMNHSRLLIRRREFCRDTGHLPFAGYRSLSEVSFFSRQRRFFSIKFDIFAAKMYNKVLKQLIKERRNMTEKYTRRRGDRKDGRWLRDLDSLHVFMPYLYPNKTDNEAFICERVDLTAVNAYMAEKNAAEPEMQYKLFQLIVAALVKTITLRPKLNRFIKGYRIYERFDLTAAFVVKKEFADDGGEALAYLSFDEDANLETVRDKVYEIIDRYRGPAAEVDNSTADMDVLCKLPRFLLRFVVWILHKLDFYGKVPQFLIKEDPNHATIFLTNLGSIGLKSGYHHLSNWGTNSLFVVLGEKRMIDGREVIDIGLTLDERIADGYYYSKSVKLFKYLLQHPELLETPAKEKVNYE